MKHTVKEYRSDTGVCGLVVDVPGSSVINLEIHFNSGFQFAERRIYELPHVLEHLIGCGSKQFPEPNSFKIEVQKNGAFRNAYTTGDTNGYVLEFAHFELKRMLDLLEQWLVEPIFPPDSFTTEISNVREELNRLESDHDTECAYNLMARTMPHKSLDLKTHIAQLPDIKLSDVTSYYKKTHTAANARFYIACDMATAGVDVADRLRQILEKLTPGERLVPDDSPGLGVAEPIVERRDVKSIHYRFASYSGNLTRQQRNAALLMRMVLFNGFSSRIYGEARRRGLAYHVGGASSAVRKVSSLGINGFVTAENITPLFELIAHEYKRLREGDLGLVELEAARDRLIGSTLRSYQTAADILSWYDGRYDAEDDIYPLDEQIEDLRQATTADVTEVTNMFVEDDSQAISFVGDINQTDASKYYRLLRPMLER